MQQVIEFVLSSIIMVVTPIIFGVLTLDNNIRRNKSKVVVAFLISCIVYSLNYLYFDGGIKTLIGFLLHIFIYNQIFDCKVSKSIFVTFVYVMVIMLIDICELFFVVTILGISKEFCYKYIAGSIVSNLIVCLLAIFLTKVFNKIFKKIFCSKIENNNEFIIISIFSIMFVIVLFFDVITNYKNNNSIISYILLIIIFLVVIANLIKEKIVINDKIQEYNGLLGFMKSYEAEIEENKIQNHEIKNQFITIGSMLKDNAPKNKILDYVNSVIDDKKNIDDARYGDLQYLPLNGIKGFICSKLNKAEEEKLNVSVVIKKGVEKSIISELSISDFKKLGILLGVYFDNAIEASVLSDKKCLGLEIYLEDGNVVIIITNTFENVIRSVEETNKRISTKGVGRGHGLQLVNKVVSGSKLFSVQSEIMGKAYIQKIKVKKIK